MFTEAIENQIEINNATNLKEMKINSYLEATMRELAINIGESELKVLKESGTSEDLAYLTEAAENGAIDKIKKVVAAAIEAFKEFISHIKDRVVKLITTAETKETMKKVEKKIKLNPFLSKKKVQVVDTKKPLQVISKYESILDKHAAKVSTGKIKPGDSKKISDLKSKFQTEYKAAIMGVAAMTTITVAALVALVNKDMETLTGGINKIDQETSASLKKMAECKAFSEETIAEQQAAMAQIVSFRASLGREKSNELVDGLSNKISVLRKTVAGAIKGSEVNKSTPKDKGFKFGKKKKPMKESYDDFDDLDDDIFGESYDDEFDDDLFGESYDDDDDDVFGESSEYLDDMYDEDSLFDESYDEDDYDLFGESYDDEDSLFDESCEDDDLFSESDENDFDSLFEDTADSNEDDDILEESYDGDLDDSFDEDSLFDESCEDFDDDELFDESAGREYTAEDLLDSIDDII